MTTDYYERAHFERTIDWIRRLPPQCVLLNPDSGSLRRFNGLRISFENGRKELVNYREMDDPENQHLMKMGDATEVDIADFAEWCQPEVRLLGGECRSCIAPL